MGLRQHCQQAWTACCTLSGWSVPERLCMLTSPVFPDPSLSHAFHSVLQTSRFCRLAHQDEVIASSSELAEPKAPLPAPHQVLLGV